MVTKSVGGSSEVREGEKGRLALDLSPLQLLLLIMTSPAPFDLPGFLWDGRRFYKAPPEAKQAPTNPENASISNKRKKAKSSQQQVKKAIPIARSRKRSTLHEQLSDLALREWNGSSRSSLHQFSQLFLFPELWQSFRELTSIL